MTCAHCDGPGGSITFNNQVCMPINGRVACIDWCIHPIVAALNAAGVVTVASCCGHEQQPGRIDLADGRVVQISSPGTNHGTSGSKKRATSDDRYTSMYCTSCLDITDFQIGPDGAPIRCGTCGRMP